MTATDGVVHVVDDDLSFLTAVARMLRGAGFTVVTHACAADLLARIAEDGHCCIIADLQMPGVGGLELQENLAKSSSAIPIIFLTGNGDIPSTVRAMRSGAEDFLSKQVPKDELINAVRRALVRNARERAERIRLRELRAPFDTLTPREREVLLHVLRGRLNKQIALELEIDERSVKRHRSSIMVKLNVDSLAALLHLVHAAGLHDPGDGLQLTTRTESTDRP